MASATARLSSTTGDGVISLSAPYSPTMRAQSVVLGGSRARMTGGDGGLQRIGAEPVAGLLGLRLGLSERSKAAADQQLVPARAVLVEQQDRLSRGTGPRLQARGLDLHQGDEAMHLGFAGSQAGQDAAEAQRFLAQLRPHPVVAGGRRVALVEDEVDHLQHRGQPLAKLGAARNLEGHLLLGQRALGAYDALGNGRLGDQEGARDLVGGQAADQAQRQGHARLGGEHRMAGGEDEAQQVVADVVVERGIEVGLRRPRPRSRSRGRAPRASCSISFRRRSRSMARCLAAAISQAPGLSGMPDLGHCSSAVTRASCASSSARPTSRTMRARPAISLACSMRKTASMA